MAIKKAIPKSGFFERPEKYKPWSAGFTVPSGCELIFTPGMTSRGADGESNFVGDAVGQARRIFAQIESVLKTAGASLEDVVKLTVYLADIEDAVPIQAVRNEIWPDDPPVSSTIQVARIAGDQLVEIEAMAAIPASDG